MLPSRRSRPRRQAEPRPDRPSRAFLGGALRMISEPRRASAIGSSSRPGRFAVADGAGDRLDDRAEGDGAHRARLAGARLAPDGCSRRVSAISEARHWDGFKWMPCASRIWARRWGVAPDAGGVHCRGVPRKSAGGGCRARRVGGWRGWPAAPPAPHVRRTAGCRWRTGRLRACAPKKSLWTGSSTTSRDRSSPRPSCDKNL
jgi:hypothetical protein